jgi:hypothetical protein
LQSDGFLCRLVEPLDDYTTAQGAVAGSEERFDSLPFHSY